MSDQTLPLSPNDKNVGESEIPQEKTIAELISNMPGFVSVPVIKVSHTSSNFSDEMAYIEKVIADQIQNNVKGGVIIYDISELSILDVPKALGDLPRLVTRLQELIKLSTLQQILYAPGLWSLVGNINSQRSGQSFEEISPQNAENIGRALALNIMLGKKNTRKFLYYVNSNTSSENLRLFLRGLYETAKEHIDKSENP